MMCPRCDTRMVEEETDVEVCGCMTTQPQLVTIPAHCPDCGWVLGTPITDEITDEELDYILKGEPT